MHLILNTMNGIGNNVVERKWWELHKQATGVEIMCQRVEAIHKWILRFKGFEIAP